MNNILTLNKISKTDLTDSVKAIYARMTSKTRMRYLSVRHQCTNMIFGKYSCNSKSRSRSQQYSPRKCSEQGIVVFNTPGANANAVKELVLCALFLSSRKIVPAIEWSKTLKGEGDAVSKLVEKGKSAFQDRKSRVKSSALSVLAQSGCL